MNSNYLKISFAGDLMCLKEQNEAIAAKGGTEEEYIRALAGLKPLFETSDYVIGNLETPVAASSFSDEPICFNTPEFFLSSLKNAGFDLLSTANNHCLDRGIDGMIQTLDNLDKYAFDHSGTYRSKEESECIFVKNIEQTKIAFVCCTFGTNSERNGVMLDERWYVDLLKKQNKKSKVQWKSEDGMPISTMIPDNVNCAAILNTTNQFYVDRIKRKILVAKEIADIVVVIPHVGGQYNPAPGIYTKWTVDWMSALGCDLIVASHPHVPLRSELVNGVFCAYSLGNCCFTPGVGYYLPNVLSEYGIVLHTYWNKVNHHLSKVSFSIVINVVNQDGIAVTLPLYDYYNTLQNTIRKECLAINNECIVNRFIGNNKNIAIEKEYWIDGFN